MGKILHPTHLNPPGREKSSPRRIFFSRSLRLALLSRRLPPGRRRRHRPSSSVAREATCATAPPRSSVAHAGSSLAPTPLFARPSSSSFLLLRRARGVSPTPLAVKHAGKPSPIDLRFRRVEGGGEGEGEEGGEGEGEVFASANLQIFRPPPRSTSHFTMFWRCGSGRGRLPWCGGSAIPSSSRAWGLCYLPGYQKVTGVHGPFAIQRPRKVYNIEYCIWNHVCSVEADSSKAMLSTSC